MKHLLLFIFTLILITGCDVDKRDEPVVDRAAEEQAVIDVINAYNRAAEKESFYEIEETLAEDVNFFGTDSAETIRSRQEFKKQIENQWKKFMIKYYPIEDVVVQMDNKATIASIIYGCPIDVIMKDDTFHLYTRNAKNLKKENGRWLISSGIVGLASTGPQYKEFINTLINGDTTKTMNKPTGDEKK